MQRPTSVPTKCMSCPFHPYQTISKHLMQLPCHPRHSLRRWSSSLFCQIRWLLSDLRYRLGHVQGQTAKHVENIRKQGVDGKMTMFDYHWLSTNTIQSNSWVQKKFQNVSEWFHCLVDPVHCLFSIFSPKQAQSSNFPPRKPEVLSPTKFKGQPLCLQNACPVPSTPMKPYPNISCNFPVIQDTSFGAEAVAPSAKSGVGLSATWGIGFDIFKAKHVENTALIYLDLPWLFLMVNKPNPIQFIGTKKSLKMFQNGFIVWLIQCTASFPFFSLSRLNLQTFPPVEAPSSISYKMQRPTSVPTSFILIA